MYKLIIYAAMAVITALLAWAVWTMGTRHAQIKHCHEILSGMAINEGASYRIVCIRNDGVLKVYE